MYIEDLITLMALRVSMNPYDSKVVSSFYDQIFAGNGFTEKQASLALKIISRQKTKIEEIVGQPIDNFISNPNFRLTKRQISNTKRLSLIDNYMFGRAFKLEFPYSEEIVNKIRLTRTELVYAAWEKDERGWIFSPDERNLKFLLDIAKNYNFEIDLSVEKFKNRVEEIFQTPEKYIPCLALDNDQFILKNVNEFMPKILTDDLVEALFQAKKMGISVWDEAVEQLIKQSNINQTVLDFIEIPSNQNFEFDLAENSLTELIPIIKNLSPVLFVIPGGHELEKMQTCLDLLSNAGITAEEISVMFRLPTETGATFNKFVKDSKLNNPIADNTKVVFISGKLPKTVVSSGIKFGGIMNFNFYGIHYTVRDLLRNHHNVVNITNKKNSRSVNFAQLQNHYQG